MGATPIRKYLYLADMQVPHQIYAVEHGLVEYMRDEAFDGVRYLGDCCDLEGLQGWEKKAPEQNDWAEVYTEFRIMNRVLDLHQAALPLCRDWRYWKGNHERRLDLFLERHGRTIENPAGSDWWRKNYKAIPELATDLRLAERGFQVYDQFDLARDGKLHMFHGGDYSKYNEAKTLDLYARPIVYGHVHKTGRFTKPAPVDENPVAAWSLPCLCDRNPRWRRGAPNAWTNGFGVAFVRPNGEFNLYIVDIIRGHFVAPSGKYY